MFLIIGFLVVFLIAIISYYGKKIESAKEKKKLEEQKENERLMEIKRLKNERLKNIEKRENIISGVNKVRYELLKPLLTNKEKNYEEQSLITAYNSYIKLFNERLKSKQYNSFIKKQIEEFQSLNKALGYDPNFEIEKLSFSKQSNTVIKKNQCYVTSNFKKLYNYFNIADWYKFLKIIKKCLPLTIAEEQYSSFFNGYELNSLKLDKNNYLFLFPCYVINIDKRSLSVFRWSEIQFHSLPYRKFSIKVKGQEYILDHNGHFTKSFVSDFNSFLSVINRRDNINFFEKTFAISEEDQIINEKKRITEEREKIFSKKLPRKYQLLKLPETESEYSNNEEERINKSFVSFLNSKNENLKVKQQKEFIEKLKQKLIQLNIKLDYPEDKDIEKLPSICEKITLKDESFLPNSFTQLYKYFSKKSKWNKFSEKIQKTDFITNEEKTDKDTVDLYSEFFKEYNTNLIYSFDKDSYLILFPCYIIYIQKGKSLEVISYEKFKLNLEHKDRKTNNPKKSGCKIIAKEYTYQNVDGTPDKRRKINPIIYTVRHFSLYVLWNGHKRLLQSDNSELLFELFSKYTEIFEDAEASLVFKKIFTCTEETDIENIISEYKTKEAKTKAKLKKQLELAEKKRLEEQQAKALEDEQRKLAIIQKQKERNEEILRKKELERRALQLFGEDISEVSQENINDAHSDMSPQTQPELPFSVENQCVITNNVFKVELKQEINTVEDEYNIVFVDSNKAPISNKRSVKRVAAGEKVMLGITLLSNIDFTLMKNCFMQIEASGKVIGEIPFKMNIAFYSDF